MFDRKLLYSRVTFASALQPEMHGPYPVLVWNTVPSVRTEEIASLMQRLFVNGCRYVVAAGTECERWHDIADSQFFALFPTEPERDANFVMTTWHTDESPEDVIFFLVYGTNFEEHDFKEFLVLQFGDDAVVESQLKAVIARIEKGELS
jgi:hypothetical protein